jgi:hypothetical protein
MSTKTVSAHQRLEELLDKQDIQEVLLRYCRGVDRRDADLIRSAYHPDAWEHHGAYRGNSLDDFVEYASGRSGLFERVCHYICNQLIEIDGLRAHSETYAIAVHQARDDNGPSQTIFGGRYVDRLEKRDGRWAITDRVVVCDWSRVDVIRPWFREGLFAQATNDQDDLVFDRAFPGPGQRLRAEAL